MAFLNSLWLGLNLILICLILLRSPDELSLQERLTPLKLFDSTKKGANFIDNLIKLLVVAYFILGVLLNYKIFSS